MNYYEIEVEDCWYFKIRIPRDQLYLISYEYTEWVPVYGSKSYNRGRYQTYQDYFYEEDLKNDLYRFQMGFASIIYTRYYDKLPQRTRSIFEALVFNNIKLPKFHNLREYQQDDLEQLLVQNRAIFQCYTSYGKTEIIATLAHYIADILNEKVIVISQTNIAVQELKSRYYKLYEVDFEYFDNTVNLNFINSVGFFKSNSYDPNDDYWKTVKWILADEVEMCCNNTVMEFYETLPQVKHMYGFSATPNKHSTRPFRAKLSTRADLKSDNHDIGVCKYLVGYFGTTGVFTRPTLFDIKVISIRCPQTIDYIVTNRDHTSNETIYNLLTHPTFKSIARLFFSKVNLIYVPMVRLEVLDDWVTTLFNTDFDTINIEISSRGIELYYKGEYIDNISIYELKELARDKVLKCIFGTSASYAALDIYELNKCLLLFSKQVRVVIQTAGRAVRQGNMKLFQFKFDKYLPVYSKDSESRIRIFREYYKNCNYSEIEIPIDYLYNDDYEFDS